jgi:acid phosphatase
MLEREKDMYPLAVRCTNALRPLLGHGSFDLSFGVDGSDEEKEKEILSWSQLAEVTCCLKVRDRLPEGITREDQEALSSYLAWRWFETLRHPRLAFLAMHKFADSIIYRMKHVDEESPLTLYSAHDSSLVGLLCVFRLEQPSEWPEYGSNLKIVLLEKSSIENDTEYVVRFYLNGSLLRSEWHGELREEISLLILDHYVSTEGAGKVQ